VLPRVLRVRTVELGHTGEQVSQVALGAMLLGTATDVASSFRMFEEVFLATKGVPGCGTGDVAASDEHKGWSSGHTATSAATFPGSIPTPARGICRSAYTGRSRTPAWLATWPAACAWRNPRSVPPSPGPDTCLRCPAAFDDHRRKHRDEL
jgi:hypothetical protein